MPRPVGPTPNTRRVFDRGRADYFHGRGKILAAFQETCDLAVETAGGTTFLVEGAPGAGKSALLLECSDRAARNGWLVAENLTPGAFCDVTEMRKQMGDLRRIQIESGKIGLWALEFSATSTITRPVDALARADKPLLLILDEAQLLHSVSSKPRGDASRSIATDTLNLIHNGRLGKPIVLLAGGLGTTTETFADLGVSRFAKRRRVELGPLEPEAERALLHDWFTIRANATGDPTPWIDTIMGETHGWPHHVMAYVDGVMEHLPNAKGVMGAETFQQVLAAGRQGCTDYYLERTRGFNEVELEALVGAFPAGQPGSTASYRTITASLSVAFPQQDAAGHLFNRAVEKGVLSKQGTQYVIPIPSMHTWLEKEYGSPRSGHPLPAA